VGTRLQFQEQLTPEHVSIQLVSPASGDGKVREIKSARTVVSIQLVSPASGDEGARGEVRKDYHVVSIQLVSPASGDLF